MLLRSSLLLILALQAHGQEPVAVERSARESAMPVTRKGRYVVASPEELHLRLC
jgi:hypothetical protein